MTAERVSPYLMDEPPTSTGRALLSRAFAHWCVLHHGHSAEEIADALNPAGAADGRDRQQIGFAARLLGELLAAGEMRAFVRPVGGGTPVPLAASAWERDDFRQVFARSALDPARPFDDAAPTTHWVFVDLADFDRILHLSLGKPLSAPGSAEGAPAPTLPAPEVAVRPGSDDLIRMPELERRTGMSRATIYRRIGQGRFPEQIEMEGNIAAWREGDVAEWLARPR